MGLRLRSNLFPLHDVVVADPYGDIADTLTTVFYIGQSNIVAGITTDMVAYASDDIFVQIWIGAEDKLPRKLRAVYRNDPARLRHDNGSLQLAARHQGARRRLRIGKGCRRHEDRVRPTDPQVPPGLQPPPKAKPGKKAKASNP